MLDRRRSLRRRTLLSCSVSARKLGMVAEGTVRNLSDGGARVTLPLDAPLPHVFEVIVSDGPPRRARLVWRRDGAAGLALEPAEGAAMAGPSVTAARGRVPSSLEARLAAIAARPTGQGH